MREKLPFRKKIGSPAQMLARAAQSSARTRHEPHPAPIYPRWQIIRQIIIALLCFPKKCGIIEPDRHMNLEA